MVKLRIIMRKFSIIRHYFITPGRYSCPGVSPARGGWPWNAGNAPVCGGAGEGRSLKVGSGNGGFRDGSGNGFGSWWLQGWFQGRFPGVGPGWFRAGDFEDVSGVVPGGCGGGSRGRCPGVVSGDGSRGWFRGRVREWRPAVGRGCAGGMVWGFRERPGEGSIRIFRAGGMP